MNDDVTVKIASLADWRGELLNQIRGIIKQSVPGVVEEVKWRKAANPLGVPTWSHHGIICTGESYKDKVKLTFMNGVALPDPHRLFTDEATGKRRAIDLRQGDTLNAKALGMLVKEAARQNSAKST